MPTNEIPELVRTLFVSGFAVRSVTHKANFTVVKADRHDEFGLATPYVIAYAGANAISSGDRTALKMIGDRNGTSVVLVSDVAAPSAEYVLFTRAQFFGKLGGPLGSIIALEQDYGQRLVTLSKNKRVIGLKGKPDDLFESYAHAGLQFLLRGRVIRYGQERRFEAVADGVTIGRNTPLLLYDCKAARRPYVITKITIRQFADYVNKFHTQWQQYVGRLHAFVALSSGFQKIDTLRDRSNELYSECSIPLVCLTADTLAKMVALFVKHAALREVVNWKEIFAPPIVEFSRVEAAVNARLRDRIIRK